MARWERRLAGGAASVVTVGDALAAELGRRFGRGDVIPIYNCPPRWFPPLMAEDRIRGALGLPRDVVIVLCHGGFMANRGLEETAEAMCRPELATAHLVFLGYRAGFIEPILADTRLAGRVHHLPAVPPADVTAWVAGADVDVMAIQPADLNSRLSTPNKLFESLAAGVPVVSSDLPARREIIVDPERGELGALCDPTDPVSIARAIESILERTDEERGQLHDRILRAAHRALELGDRVASPARSLPWTRLPRLTRRDAPSGRG